MVIHLFSRELILKFRRVFLCVCVCVWLVTVNMYELCSKCHTWGFPVTGVIYDHNHIQLYERLTSLLLLLNVNNRFTFHKGYNRS